MNLQKGRRENVVVGEKQDEWKSACRVLLSMKWL